MSISAYWMLPVRNLWRCGVHQGRVGLSFIEDIHGLYYLCGLFPARACSWRRGRM